MLNKKFLFAKIAKKMNGWANLCTQIIHKCMNGRKHATKWTKMELISFKEGVEVNNDG